MDVVTLPEARERGLVRYFTGKACKRGHVCERHTSSATCMDCDRAAYAARAPRRRLTMRAYQEANRELCRAACRRWRARQKAEENGCRSPSH